MRLPLRSFLASLAPVVVLALLTALGTGCSSGADTDADGPTVTATGPDTSTSAASGTPGDDPTGPASDLPPAAAAVCAPYAAMVAAIQNAASSSGDRDEIAAAIGPVMKEFAAQVPGLERPPGMSAATWRGVEALAAEIVDLPDRPTYAEIEAVEGQLSAQQKDAIEDAQAWLRTNCA